MCVDIVTYIYIKLSSSEMNQMGTNTTTTKKRKADAPVEVQEEKQPQPKKTKKTKKKKENNINVIDAETLNKDCIDLNVDISRFPSEEIFGYEIKSQILGCQIVEVDGQGSKFLIYSYNI